MDLGLIVEEIGTSNLVLLAVLFAGVVFWGFWGPARRRNNRRNNSGDEQRPGDGFYHDDEGRD